MMHQNLLWAVLSRLDRGDTPDSRWPDAKGEYWALCPFHPDTHATNFSVSERGYKCFACGAKGGLKALAEHLGVNTTPQDDGLTIARYAWAKNLPLDFLKGLGVRERHNGRGPYLEIPYYDEYGTVVAVRRRYRLEKSPDKDGRFAWNRGSRLVPYGLWRLNEMRGAGWVMVLEGESDCHTAWHYGLPALGIPGASTWKEEWADYLKGVQVFLWQEPDEGGKSLVHAMSRTIPVEVMSPPEGIKDLSEAHIKGLNVSALVERMRANAKTHGASDRIDEPPTRDYGHAQVLASLWHDRYRWAAHRGTWMAWSGAHWEPITEAQVSTQAADALRGHYAAQLMAAKGRDEIKRLTALITETCVYARIQGALAFLKGFDGFHTDAQAWDADPWLLNVANGTLDLRTGTLRPHRPSDLCTKLAPAAYDPNAKAPAWEAHLAYFLPNANVRRQVQRDLGMALVGTSLEERLPIWYGIGANGKSTTAKVILAVLGDYASMAAPGLLILRRHESHPTEIADLVGRRLVFSSEISGGARLDEARVKLLTGGDRQKARFMRQDFFEFTQTWSLIMFCNHKPVITGTDTGIWRRVRLIPWEVSIPEEKREPQDAVIARLLEEGPGILRWLMEGLADWQQEPHWVATEVLMATEAYRAEQDRLATFLEERCEIGSRFSVTAGDLYNAYEEWCRESGESAVSKRELGQMLRERGFEQSRAHGGVRVWRGLRVRTTLDETIDDVDAFIADACSIVRGAETTVGDLYDAYCEWCAEHGATAMPKNQFGQMLSEKGFAQRRDRENRFWVGIQIKKNVPDPFREIDDLLDELWK